MRLKRNMVFNFRKLLTLRRGRQTWLEAIISLRNLNYMVFWKPAKLHVFHLQWCSIFYALQRNFTHLGTIFTLCASAQFHAPWYDFYFMRFEAIIILCASAQFYAKQFSSLAGFYPDRGGVEVTGQTASLLAKAAPSLQHHSSIGSWSLSMTIFLKLSPPLTNYNVYTLIPHGSLRF